MSPSAATRALVAISRMPPVELSMLLQTSGALAASLDIDEVMQTAIESAVRMLGLDTGAIYLVDGADLVLGATTPPCRPSCRSSSGASPSTTTPT